MDEIRQLPFRPAYCFLSPIFDSISKTGYREPIRAITGLIGHRLSQIALGGLEPDKTGLCRRAGFEGIAVLGYLWNNPDEAIERYIRLKTPFVLSIAGFDPSSGAGIGADLKTFEATGSYGLGVCSALTFQNEDTFTGVHWTAWEDIKKQCDLLLQKVQCRISENRTDRKFRNPGPVIGLFARSGQTTQNNLGPYPPESQCRFFISPVYPPKIRKD